MERYLVRWTTKGNELATTLEDRAEAEALRDAIIDDVNSELIEFKQRG